MALAADSRQYLFLDSSRRNRKDYPHASEFVSVIGANQNLISDPLADGGIIYQDTVGAAAYVPGNPGRIELAAGISTSQFENELLDQYLEVLNVAGPNLISRGSSKVIGFANIGAPPNTFANWIYLKEALATAPVAGELLVVRQFSQKPYHRYLSPPVAAPTNSLTIGGGSSRDNEYRQMFLKVIGDNTEYVITAYNGTTKVATIQPALAAPMILPFTLVEIYARKENAPGLAGNGSMASRTSPSNHEIGLEWIRIPRQPLFVHEVLDPSVIKTVNDFNYLLVQFRNLGDPSNGAIQSNNTQANRAQFIVPVEDLTTGVGKFFTLRSPCRITVKYNPQEPIHFGVYLPNGTPLQFDTDDTRLGSIQPNPDLQITAMFGIKRVLH